MPRYFNDEPEPVEHKPTLFLTSDDLEAISEWEVGEKYTVLVEMRQVSKSERSEDKTCGEFTIEKIKELPKSKGSFSKDEIKVALSMKNLDYLR